MRPDPRTIKPRTPSPAPRPEGPASFSDGAGPLQGGEPPAPGAPEWADGVMDRRTGVDRRDVPAAPAAAGPDDFSGLDRRRGPGRRRTDFTRSAEEGEMTAEQFLFVAAVEAFKKANGKMFPTWTDVLEVVRLLGYRKTMPSELGLRNVEDWREKPDAPSGVRSKPGHPERERRAA